MKNAPQVTVKNETRPVQINKMDMQLWYRCKMVAAQNRETLPEFVQRALKRELSFRTSQPVKSPVPISGSNPASSEQGVDPVHGAASLHTRPVPSELKPFCDRAMERTTVIAALKYLKDEMAKTAGAEGLRIYQRITMRVPRTFSTREKCAAANINCWLDIWDELQALKNAHGFAKAVNS